MQNWKLTIAYDGTRFSGWQIQAAGRTVQGEIEACLSTIFDSPISITGAGRTDAGVHALGQVANARFPERYSPEELRFRLNRMLDGDLSIELIEPVEPDFSARFSATSKVYQYRIVSRKIPHLRDFALNIERALDLDVLSEAASLLVGTHDFSAFAVKKSLPERPLCNILRAEWSSEGEIVNLTIEGNRFLHQMIRGLVGAQLDLERGQFTIADFEGMIQAGQRLEDFTVVPPHGLFLMRVIYP